MRLPTTARDVEPLRARDVISGSARAVLSVQALQPESGVGISFWFSSLSVTEGPARPRSLRGGRLEQCPRTGGLLRPTRRDGVPVRDMPVRCPSRQTSSRQAPRTRARQQGRRNDGPAWSSRTLPRLLLPEEGEDRQLESTATAATRRDGDDVIVAGPSDMWVWGKCLRCPSTATG